MNIYLPSDGFGRDSCGKMYLFKKSKFKQSGARIRPKVEGLCHNPWYSCICSTVFALICENIDFEICMGKLMEVTWDSLKIQAQAVRISS